MYISKKERNVEQRFSNGGQLPEICNDFQKGCEDVGERVMLISKFDKTI